MSKFCGVCGAEMRDDAVVCSNCGTQLRSSVENFGQGAPAKNGTDIMNKIKGLSKSGGSNSIKMFAPIAAAVVAIIVVLSIVLSSFGYKNVVKKYVKAIDKNDPSIAEKLVSKTLLEAVEDEDLGIDLGDLMEYEIEGIRDDFDDELESKYSVSYEILSVKDFDEDDIEEFNEEFEDSDEIDMTISKAKKVKVSIKAKSGKNTETYKTELLIIKEKGKLKWTLLPVNLF